MSRWVWHYYTMELPVAASFLEDCTCSGSRLHNGQNPVNAIQHVHASRNHYPSRLTGGAINIVTGDGPVVGERLVESTLVDKIAFTGSTAVGKRIMAKAAPTLKRISLNWAARAQILCSRMLIWQQQWAVPSSYLPQQRSGLSNRFPFTAARVDQRRVHAAAGSSNKDYQIRRSKGPTTTMDR